MNIGKFISIIHRNRQQYIKDKMKELNLDIGISDFPIILILNGRGKQGTSEIAKNYALTNSQVSQSIRRLEKLGYITQERNKEQRHKVIIDITDKGIEMAKILKDISNSWHDITNIGFDDEEMNTLQEGLRKVALNISEEDISSILKKGTMKR